MATPPSATARHLGQVLQEKLIPFAQNGAPIILFDAPPRSRGKENFAMKNSQKLLSPLRKMAYPQYFYWPSEHVNSIGVPVLGCVFEGEADYDVRNIPGKPGRSWIIPVSAGTFFMVQPGIPFTADKLAWERPTPQRAYARGMVLHLRRDGIISRSYTIDRGNLWKHPSLFLHEPQAHLLGERLLDELRRPQSTFDVISYHYLLLIFHLMRRCLAENQYVQGYAAMAAPPRAAGDMAEMPVEMEATFPDPVNIAKEYIAEHLDNAELSAQRIAQYAGLSARHLNRLFKEQETISLFGYLQRQKLMQARLLLENPAISIEQVATYCGFRQRSHFSAWFTKQNHISPSVYRVQLNKKK